MKRYRVLNVAFDTRARILGTKIEDHWEPKAKEVLGSNKKQIIQGILAEYGPLDAERKIKDFQSIEAEPFSVVAYHNKFLRQIRTAFTAGSYYPSLTGACALGERILNHLVLGLRESYRASPEYKHVYRKASFDNWDLAINTLEAWNVFRPEVALKYRELRDARNAGVHFRPETDTNDRELALRAIRLMSDIIALQFGGIGPLPWFIPGTMGAVFLKHDWITDPFIQLVYLPNCTLVGPYHEVEHVDGRWHAIDRHEYEDREVSDEEFTKLFNERSGGR